MMLLIFWSWCLNPVTHINWIFSDYEDTIYRPTFLQLAVKFQLVVTVLLPISIYPYLVPNALHDCSQAINGAFDLIGSSSRCSVRALNIML
jgi:hypothetical protein